MLRTILITTLLLGCGRYEPSWFRGPAGKPGTDGTNGSQGPVGSQGVPGSQGVKGDTGATGSKGDTGAQGSAGDQGPRGLPGTPGSKITPVVPCADDAKPYPETLLCIDGTLYAVYDPNPKDVHYTAVPPGNYVTTDGRSCFFSVTAGCNIQ